MRLADRRLGRECDTVFEKAGRLTLDMVKFFRAASAPAR
jgi:hypothetical protein